jgi:nicotinic acid mononucleotide adenylyltransferase
MIPCGYRPDKTHISAPEHRLNMVKQAVEDFFGKEPSLPIVVDDIEIQNGNSIPSYFLMN